jgi:hypothetical protein
MYGLQTDRIERVEPNFRFWQICKALWKLPEDQATNLQIGCYGENLLAIDPGETTGICIWDGDKAAFFICQLETKEIGPAYVQLHELIQKVNPTHVRAEDYRIYSWMTEQHAGTNLHTPKLIGAIEVAAHNLSVPCSLVMAQQPKALWNDDNLKLAGLYNPGLKHGRDALRHACYYIANL